MNTLGENDMLTFIVRLVSFAVGSLIGSWLAIDLPEIIQEHRHKKNDIESAATREQEKCRESD